MRPPAVPPFRTCGNRANAKNRHRYLPPAAAHITLKTRTNPFPSRGSSSTSVGGLSRTNATSVHFYRASTTSTAAAAPTVAAFGVDVNVSLTR